jgi:hypothetical protein
LLSEDSLKRRILVAQRVEVLVSGVFDFVIH